ncbi:hypothetical protein JTB14_030902 [Gonioctena quinquepunctata]|nr:hypothetical protein JTB14_030902 [Gonioctena quinquepunctata]
MHLPDFDSSDEETLASKRQGPPTTKQDSNISDVPDREGEQSDSSDEETLASKRARLNQSIPNHADNVPQWAKSNFSGKEYRKKQASPGTETIFKQVPNNKEEAFIFK